MAIEDHSPHLADYDEEELNKYHVQQEVNFLRSVYKDQIKKVTDKKLIDKILHEAPNRVQINNIVPSGRFRAFDIAQKIKINGYHMTSKQREALENIWAYVEANRTIQHKY